MSDQKPPVMKSVFVSGGSGFVGRNLIRALVARGASVKALARSPTAIAQVLVAGAVAVPGDLGDEAALRAGMEGCDTVFHAAAIVSDWGKREEFYDSTVRGTQNMLFAARMARVGCFVHVGTEAVLAGGQKIINADETTPYPASPVGLYPWSKMLAEQAVVAANVEGFRTLSVRPRFIWGGDDSSLLPQLADAMRKGQWVWFGGARHKMSTCHVANVVEGTLLAAQFGKGGEIYFLTDGAPVVFREFITKMMQTQGIVPPDREMPLWVAKLLAAVGESVWRIFGLPGRPPITRTMVNLLFDEVTVNDRKACETIFYRGAMTIDQGMADLAARHKKEK